MKWLDLTCASPAENLACDEALLDWCEEGHGQEVIRFWQPGELFVVVGYANRVATEINVEVCRERGIPILRRCTGGGTILQGPGCLNYSLLLDIDVTGRLGGVTETNSLVMETNRKALQSLTTEPIEVRGHTDLAVNEVKFSGNAQRRRRRYCLFHGSILLSLDLRWVEEVLNMPSQQPAYRQNRGHREFVRNLGLPMDLVKEALRLGWGATGPLEEVPHGAIARLAREKYSTDEWNFKL